MIMPLSELPLVGFSVTRDESSSTRLFSSGWNRVFASQNGQYWYAEFGVSVFGNDVKASGVIADTVCSELLSFTFEQPVVTEVTAEVIGDGAKACRFAFRTAGDWFAYVTGTRNVTVMTAVEVRTASAAQGIAMCVQLAKQQMGIIERVAPR
jgi:hypothetical protein